MAYSLVWEQTQIGQEEGLYSLGLTKAGEIFTAGHICIGIAPTKFIFNLRKSNTPTGTTALTLIASDDTLKATFTPTIVPNDLTTSFVAHEFINDSNVETIEDGDRVIFTYTGDQYFRIQLCSSCAESGTKETSYDGSWTDSPTKVCTMKVYKAGAIPPSTGTRLPPPPITVRF